MRHPHAFEKESLTMAHTIRALIVAMALAAGSLVTATAANAQTCQPGIGPAFATHQVDYVAIAQRIVPSVNAFRTLLAAVEDQATYESLLVAARAVANLIPNNGRVLITLPDGTVVVDTARTDDPANANPTGNSYQHFQNKTVNENHNSRVAIMAAQMFECGLAVERRLSTTTGQVETYFANRLGTHLDSVGTVRGSSRQ